MKRLALIVLLVGLGARGVSAQLAYYVDESGRRIYVNPGPKPDLSVPSVSKAPSASKTPKRTLRVPAKSKVEVPVPYTTTASAPAPEPAKIKPPVNVDAVVEETARRHDVDVNLVKAMIHTESNNNPRAVSYKGAMGLMQLMPPTARDLGVANAFDPAQNVDGGVRYLKYLLGLYGGDLNLSLAAYNAGPGAVEHYGGIPPYRETRDYVKKIGDRYGSLRTQVSAPRGIVRTVDESGKVVYTNLQ